MIVQNEVQRISSFKTVKRPVVKKINGSKGFKLFAGSNTQRSTGLCMEVLQKLTPFKDDEDKVTESARELLIDCVKHHPTVHDVFFPDVSGEARMRDEDYRGFPMERLAVGVICEALAGCEDEFKFHTTLERNNLASLIGDLYSSVHWKKLGFALYTQQYPTVVRDVTSGISLQDFIDDDGPEWAEQILERMTEPNWTLSWVQKIVRGLVTEEDYNTQMNALFVKLHLLDPQSVIPAYHLLNNIRALPECSLELATRDYIGGPLDSQKFQPAVICAVHVPTRAHASPHNTGTPGTPREVFYGVHVDEWLMTEARDLGVWNGRRPNNSRPSAETDRCVVM
ncbi:hypothetical protein MAR_031791 [Mya arenaria]|uniref:Uncharacterized protein n=1 Tax=Mya arenaria TaxID=6604 RepID=A0ABY7F4U8_MYAAR|nr:uncharacterized protein LOC128206345 [Mya arenaria]WAR17197.1 hypothetical protein MAR_031791 [Mya arenaria]